MSKYIDERNAIRRDFEDGVDLIYHIMFTDSIFLYLLNEEETKPNVYGEAIDKVYHDPIQLSGGVNLHVVVSPENSPAVEKDMVVRIATKQLKQNNIAFASEEDLDVLRKAKIRYKEAEYVVDFIRPKIFVADSWHSYDFECTKVDE